MAHLMASAMPTSSLSRGLFSNASVSTSRSRAAQSARIGAAGSVRWGSFGDGGRKRSGFPRGETAGMRCSAPAGEVGRVGEEDEGGGSGWGVGVGEKEYLVREFGWGVRRMAMVGEEMRRVARIQAEAFHVPVALFDDFFFQFFEAEVLSALIYRIRSSAPDRYACLVAEPMDASNLLCTSLQGLVGVVDVTVQSDDGILRYLEGAEEYLYVSGIGVSKIYRRRKVASALLKACDALSELWRYNYLVLHAYEDDLAAMELYSKAGYKAVSGDPWWVTSIGRRRRVIMIKQSCVGLVLRFPK